MAFRCGQVIAGILLCAAVMTSPEVFAEDCGPASPNPASTTCLPGTYVYQQQQQQKEQQEQQQKVFQQQQEAAAASAAAAADPRNQNDPSSPYYGLRQCEEAKHSFYCALGILCTPANVDCAKFAPRAVVRHHHRHDSY